MALLFVLLGAAGGAFLWSRKSSQDHERAPLRRAACRMRRSFEITTRLRGLAQPLSRSALQALGYKEVFDHLDGRASLEETKARVQTRTRNFAKRQLTWFRHLPGCFRVTRELTFAEWGLTIGG